MYVKKEEKLIPGAIYIFFPLLRALSAMSLPRWTATGHLLFPSEPLFYLNIHSTFPHLFHFIHPLHISCVNKNLATSQATSYLPHVPTRCRHTHAHKHTCERKVILQRQILHVETHLLCPVFNLTSHPFPRLSLYH